MANPLATALKTAARYGKKVPTKAKVAAAGAVGLDVASGGQLHESAGNAANALGSAGKIISEQAEQFNTMVEKTSQVMSNGEELQRRIENFDWSSMLPDAGLLGTGLILGSGDGVMGIAGKVMAVGGLCKTGYDLYQGLIANDPSAVKEMSEYGDDQPEGEEAQASDEKIEERESEGSKVELDDEGKARQAKLWAMDDEIQANQQREMGLSLG